MRIHDIMNEAPITDYQTIGDFDKNSSFRKERDRKLIKNPSTIEYVKRKFANTDYNLAFYFVNSAAANKHTEVGEVDINWVKDNLGTEVYDKISNNDDNDSIKIIFTNNKGAEGVPLTAWVMAHRISHALHRKDGRNVTYLPHNQAENQFINTMGIISDVAYNKPFDARSILMNRKEQLLFKHIAHNICTFKSAREKNLRDYFEAFNELFAQYVTTGKITFNELPPTIKANNSIIASSSNGDLDTANQYLYNLESDLAYLFDDSLSYAIDRIYVM